jgi:hypothetical protein
MYTTQSNIFQFSSAFILLLDIRVLPAIALTSSTHCKFKQSSEVSRKRILKGSWFRYTPCGCSLKPHCKPSSRFFPLSGNSRASHVLRCNLTKPSGISICAACRSGRCAPIFATCQEVMARHHRPFHAGKNRCLRFSSRSLLSLGP